MTKRSREREPLFAVRICMGIWGAFICNIVSQHFYCNMVDAIRTTPQETLLVSLLLLWFLAYTNTHPLCAAPKSWSTSFLVLSLLQRSPELLVMILLQRSAELLVQKYCISSLSLFWFPYMWWLMLMYSSITEGFSPILYCWLYVTTLGNPLNTM